MQFNLTSSKAELLSMVIVATNNTGLFDMLPRLERCMKLLESTVTVNELEYQELQKLQSYLPELGE